MRNFYGNCSYEDIRCFEPLCSFVCRNHSRYKTKEGFIDSSRRVRSLQRQQDDLQSSKHISPLRGGLLASITKSSSSAPAMTIQTRRPKKPDNQELTPANLENKKREYEKQMRLIEVH